MKFPMDHRIQRPQHYIPAVATDIRKTFTKVRKSIGDQVLVERVTLEMGEVRPLPLSERPMA